MGAGRGWVLIDYHWGAVAIMLCHHCIVAVSRLNESVKWNGNVSAREIWYKSKRSVVHLSDCSVEFC